MVLGIATVLFAWGALAERSSGHREPVGGHDVTQRTTASTIAVEADNDQNSVDGHETTTTRSETAHSETSGEHGETPTSAGSVDGDAHGAGGSETAATHTESSPENRRVLGVNLESLWVILAGTAASVALAILVLYRKQRWPVVAVAMLGAAFVALEIAEVVHHHAEARTGLVVVAALAATAHLIAAILAASELIAVRRRTKSQRVAQ